MAKKPSMKFVAALMLGSALTLVTINAVQGAAPVAAKADPLWQGFVDPPQSAHPRVWWHWMNGNVTKDGIQKDIEWMHKVGVAGMDSIDASLLTPQVVEKRLSYMQPDWKDAFRFSTQLADKYGMELSINSSPGWSETGGPWVTPAEGMKKMVWSRTVVEGGKPFRSALPKPPNSAGLMQDAVFPATSFTSILSIPFYRDAVVVAYRQPVADARLVGASSSDGKVDAQQLTDGKLNNGFTLKPKSAVAPAWVMLTLDKPTRLQGVSISVSVAGAADVDKKIEVSQDGVTWSEAASVKGATDTNPTSFGPPQQTVSFAPVMAKYVRVSLKPAAVSVPAVMMNMVPGVSTDFMKIFMPSGPLLYTVHEFVPLTAGTVNDFEYKAGFGIAADNYAIATKSPVEPGTVVQSDNVIDLTSKMKPDGTLDWTPPAGRWVVLRIGYSLEGTTNHPATAEATGLEVDKLNAGYVNKYLNHYLDTYESITGPELFGKRGLKAMMVDSTEVGPQNWTDTILADFKRLRGYDPTPWLPVLTGVMVGSPADSDKFLWDFRTTIADLLAENHYHEIAKVSHQRNLVNYGEALEDHRPTFGDDFNMRKFADIPMSAMWAWPSTGHPQPTYIADVQGAASVSHLYGQNLVAAESMTAAFQPWALGPSDLKTVMDLAFAKGVNRVVVHTSVHQPIDKPPGLTLSLFGQYFNRLDTWADYAKPWVDYLSRTSYMLQQGRYVADIAYFYGEEAPLTSLYGKQEVSDVPWGYGFDFINADALQEQIKADDGGLVSKSGMRYRILYLGGSSHFMTLKTLSRIKALVEDGAVLVGKRPASSPSLHDDDAQFTRVADELFGAPGTGAHMLGKGRVFPDGSLANAVTALKLAPDLQVSKGDSSDLLELHRKLADGDAYFVVNRKNQDVDFNATFRVAGYAPQVWHAEDGSAQPVSYRIDGERTQVPMKLHAHEAVFVVFRKPATVQSLDIAAPVLNTVQTLDGAWSVAFQANRGAPANITMPQLASWSKNADSGVKYFSGTGTYTKTFTLSAAAVKRGKLQLDLGKVYEVADVTLNGKHIGIVWHAPYVVDISGAAVAGKNVLKVAVADLWANRLIGDQQPGVQKKYTFTVIPTYNADAPLPLSGLVGPVTLVQAGKN